MKFPALLAIYLAMNSCGSCARTQKVASYHDIRKLQRTASTPDELQQLATYYRQKEGTYRAHAAEERVLLETALTQVSPGAKYPTEAERARRLLDYYQAKAEAARGSVEEYENRAKALAVTNAGP